jgi:hypothetical protein
MSILFEWHSSITIQYTSQSPKWLNMGFPHPLLCRCTKTFCEIHLGTWDRDLLRKFSWPQQNLGGPGSWEPSSPLFRVVQEYEGDGLLGGPKWQTADGSENVWQFKIRENHTSHMD